MTVVFDNAAKDWYKDTCGLNDSLIRPQALRVL